MILQLDNAEDAVLRVGLILLRDKLGWSCESVFRSLCDKVMDERGFRQEPISTKLYDQDEEPTYVIPRMDMPIGEEE